MPLSRAGSNIDTLLVQESIDGRFSCKRKIPESESSPCISAECDNVRNLFKSKGLLVSLSLGAGGFGEFFRNMICRHLNKNCLDDEIVAFHEYMQKQVAADQLVSKQQFDALKNEASCISVGA